MAFRPLYWFAIAVAALAMLGAGLWAAIALWVRLMPASLASDIVACAMVLLTLAAMICLGCAAGASLCCGA